MPLNVKEDNFGSFHAVCTVFTAVSMLQAIGLTVVVMIC